jgi:small subunit ribosomal protein S1
MSDNEDFAALFNEFEQQQAAATRREPKVGDKVRGKVLSIQGESVFVDLGTKTEGVVDRSELLGEDGELTVAVGDSLETLVSGKDPDSGVFLLGHQQARRLHGIEELRRAYEEGSPVEGHVSGTTKGGLEVEMSGARAFCPASQADIRFVEDLQEFVGQRLAFRITKFEGGRHPNLVLSRRALLEEEQRQQAEQTRARLEVGAVLPGRVSSLKDFGAFIDLGGIEGMVHVSELSFGRVKHPQEVLSVGQSVEVAVLRIEKSDNPRQGERIALSLRALEKDPWQDVPSQFPVGTRVRGTVSRLQPFGAFVELAPGVDGLVHISELGAGKRVNHPSEVLVEGQEVEATVLGVDPEKKRISLSLSAQEGSAEAPAEIRTPADYARPKQGFGTLGDLLRESMAKQKK